MNKKEGALLTTLDSRRYHAALRQVFVERLLVWYFPFVL